MWKSRSFTTEKAMIRFLSRYQKRLDFRYEIKREGGDYVLLYRFV
jgi:hypothetical protein